MVRALAGDSTMTRRRGVEALLVATLCLSEKKLDGDRAGGAAIDASNEVEG